MIAGIRGGTGWFSGIASNSFAISTFDLAKKKPMSIAHRLFYYRKKLSVIK
jgi:hypothetical protein